MNDKAIKFLEENKAKYLPGLNTKICEYTDEWLDVYFKQNFIQAKRHQGPARKEKKKNNNLFSIKFCFRKTTKEEILVAFSTQRLGLYS